MKNVIYRVYNQMSNQLEYQIGNQLEYHIGNQVSTKIRNKVSNIVIDVVTIRVSHRVWNQVRSQVTENKKL